MCMSLAYAKGSRLPPLAPGEPRTLGEVLVRAANVRPNGSISVYGGSSKAVVLSYAMLLACARRISYMLTKSGATPGDQVVITTAIPPVVQICVFWGCVLSGISACLVKDITEKELRQVFKNPIIVTFKGLPNTLLPSSIHALAVDDCLHPMGSAAENVELTDLRAAQQGGARPEDVATAVLSGHNSQQPFWYTHTCVLAHHRAQALALDSAMCADSRSVQKGASPCLIWMPLNQASNLLAHCRAVCECADQVHVKCGSDPKWVLKIAQRHSLVRTDAPPIFFRRALGVLKASIIPAGEIRTVQMWVIQGASLSDIEFQSFVDFVGGTARMFATLVAPFGMYLAVTAASSNLLPAPLLGVEVKVVDDDGRSVTVNEQGFLCARGPFLAPGVNDNALGWAHLDTRGKLVNGTFFACEQAIIPIAGAEYLPSEIELAVEACQGVRSGSAIAVSVAAELICTPGKKVDSHESSPHLTKKLIIAFVPENPSMSTRSYVVAAVRSQLAVSLGIHPYMVLPLMPCHLPRSCEGEPDRHAFCTALQNGIFADVMCESSLEAENLFPSSWALEEDFRAEALAVAGNLTEETEEDGDGDDIEERMEGIAPEVIDDSPEAAVGSLVKETPMLVTCDSKGIGPAVCQAFKQYGKADLLPLDIMIETLAAKPRNIQALVYSLQCDPIPPDSRGSTEASRLLALLQSCGQARMHDHDSCARVVCVSVGQHVRMSGHATDPRKSLALGILLAAMSEWPWLNATHIDVAPGLEASKAAEGILAEVLTPRPTVTEVLLDNSGQRLVRCFRQAALQPADHHGSQKKRKPVLRAALIAGGTGGIGSLMAQSLHSAVLILLGRSSAMAPHVSKSLNQLSNCRSDIFYIQADICEHAHLKNSIRRCSHARMIEFAANLCEMFVPPESLADLQSSSLIRPACKLQGCANLLSELSSLHHGQSSRNFSMPVLIASSAVSLLGASRLAPYIAGARAVEALCAHHRLAAGPLDPRCAAMSAWDAVGITTEFPAMSQAAPAAGLHVLSAGSGILALEAIFGRFASPRHGTLAVGINMEHPRFAAHVQGGSQASKSPTFTTSSVAGCIDLVQLAVKRTLRKDVKLGDGLVEAGLDSMTSLSLHSALVEASGGLAISPSIFYEYPSVLEIAKFIHRESSATGAQSEEGSAEGGGQDDVEALLEDDDARRSYHLGLAREAFRCNALQDAKRSCQRAAEGAECAALATVRALEAEVLQALGDPESAGAALASALSARESCSGPIHPDTAVAVVRRYLWTEKHSRGETPELQRRFQLAKHTFFKCICWPAPAWPPPDQSPNLSEIPQGLQVRNLRTIHLDAQGLEELPESVSTLHCLEVLRLRRNALKHIPSGLSQCTQLRELLLTSNFLADLPEELSQLVRLHILGIERNMFSNFPAVVYKFRRLLQLSLDEQRCSMNVGQDCRIQTNALWVLRARGCKAAFPNLTLPSSGPPNLNTVFWANNQITEVPGTLTKFSESLRLLDLAHNLIREIGEEVFDLHNLRDLSLAGNRLVTLPPKIGRMRCLQQLWLHGNLLEQLPEELGELGSLAILELHHNRIRALPASFSRLKKLNWLFAHGNQLSDGPELIRTLAQLPRLKICGLGANRLRLADAALRGLRPSFGLAWNVGLAGGEAVLSETLTTTDLYWERASPHQIQDVLIITFSAQGAPIAQGQAEVRALRDALLHVDALYVCDPANAWYMQDPGFAWAGLEYFEAKIKEVTSKYQHVFIWGGSMGGSAALLFAQEGHCVHAFSPQVDLAFTWPSFASDAVRSRFRERIQQSVLRCRGTVTVHVGEENHNDVRHVSALPASVKVHFHDTANHNTMKHVKQREKLLPLLKFEVLGLLTGKQAAQ